MKIHLERSGGYAGMIMSTTVDTKTLSSNEAKELQNLIEKSHIFELSSDSFQQSSSKTKKVQQITLHTKLQFKMEIENILRSAMI